MTTHGLDHLRRVAAEAAVAPGSAREALLAQAVLELAADPDAVEIVLKLTDRAKEVATASSWSFKGALESLMVASGYVVAPVYSLLDSTRAIERRTMTMRGNQTWRQRGWIGQTGRIYGLREDPSKTEKGSFAPLWELIDDEPPFPDGLNP